jgi:hypothetical protein
MASRRANLRRHALRQRYDEAPVPYAAPHCGAASVIIHAQHAALDEPAPVVRHVLPPHDARCSCSHLMLVDLEALDFHLRKACRSRRIRTKRRLKAVWATTLSSATTAAACHACKCMRTSSRSRARAMPMDATRRQRVFCRDCGTVGAADVRARLPRMTTLDSVCKVKLPVPLAFPLVKMRYESRSFCARCSSRVPVRTSSRTAVVPVTVRGSAEMQGM